MLNTNIQENTILQIRVIRFQFTNDPTGNKSEKLFAVFTPTDENVYKRSLTEAKALASRGSKKSRTFSFSLKKLSSQVLPDLASAIIIRNGTL